MKSIVGFVLLSLFVFNCAMAYPPEAIYKCAVNLYDHNNKIEFNQTKVINMDDKMPVSFDVPSVVPMTPQVSFVNLFGKPITLTAIEKHNNTVYDSSTFYHHDNNIHLDVSNHRAFAMQIQCVGI